jgi:hypothetical protein
MDLPLKNYFVSFILFSASNTRGIGSSHEALLSSYLPSRASLLPHFSLELPDTSRHTSTVCVLSGSSVLLPMQQGFL